jgi:carbonic anhydrase/acetyltransferase-like protein (isoleucine patch superfamily)
MNGSETHVERFMSVRSHAGLQPKIAASVYIDPDATVIGDVELGEGSSVWPMTVIRGDIHRIRIGARTSVQDGSILHVTHAGPYNPDGFPLLIGDDVTIGHKAMLHGCTIANRVLVGMAAVIMDGAIVNDEIIIAAGTLVPPGKVLESGFLYMGNPVRQARPLSEREMKFFRYTSKRYVDLAAKYLEESESG